mgnify:CR=1 FL=1
MIGENDAFNELICSRYLADYKLEAAGLGLYGGKCPRCYKPKLHVSANTPYQIECQQCGWLELAAHLYPELFADFNQAFAATEGSPSRTADAAMEYFYGIPKWKSSVWWEQGNYWNPNGDKGTATIRFYLDDKGDPSVSALADEDGGTFWEKLIVPVAVAEPKTGEKFTIHDRAKGEFNGIWWNPPGQTLAIGDKVYLTVSIIDCLSLVANDIKAVAFMKRDNFPSEAIKPHLGKEISWVLALDNSAAGRKASKKLAVKLAELKQNVECALTSESPDKCDWNDLHIRKKLNPEYLQDYLYYGALELAKSAQQKALILWRRNPLKKFVVFTFGNETYRLNLDEDEYAKAYDRAVEHFSNTGNKDPAVGGGPSTGSGRTASAEAITPTEDDEIKAQQQAFSQIAKVNLIANFRLEYLYSQLPANGEDGLYFLKVNHGNGQKPFQCAVSGEVFGEAKRFKKAMQIKAHGALFKGFNNDMDYMYENWFKNPQKAVRVVDFVGYDEDTGAYVYPQYAIEHGKIIGLNDQHFFTLKDCGIKTCIDIGQRLTDQPPADFWPDYTKAFGLKGIVAFAWFVGTLVSVQIRDKHSSYPFLQLIGEKSSGKSALMNFLFKLTGRANDNFNPNVSTVSGRYREFSKYSNLPVVVNEVDNENEDNARYHVKKFLWDEQKDLYEGHLGRITGNKSNDNSTRKPMFRGAFAATQNIDIRASEAMLARFVYLNMDKSHHSEAGYHAAARLRDLDITEVSGFLLKATSKASQLLDEYANLYPKYRKELMAMKGVEEPKVITNYAQMMSLCDCLKLLVPIDQAQINQAHDLLKKGAWQWQQSLDGDHSVVQQFWYNVEYLDSRTVDTDGGLNYRTETDLINHANNPAEEIAISIEHYIAKCFEAKLETPTSKDLRNWLPTSRRYKFLRVTSVRSRIEKRVLRCLVFKGPIRGEMD